MAREIIKDSFQSSTNRDYNSTNEVFTSIMIVNRGTASLTLRVHSYILTVDVDEVLDEQFALFSAFSIEATGPYEVQLRGLEDEQNT